MTIAPPAVMAVPPAMMGVPPARFTARVMFSVGATAATRQLASRAATRPGLSAMRSGGKRLACGEEHHNAANDDPHTHTHAPWSHTCPFPPDLGALILGDDYGELMAAGTLSGFLGGSRIPPHEEDMLVRVMAQRAPS